MQTLTQTGANVLGQATAGRSAASAALGNYARDYGRDASGLTMQTGQAVQNSLNQEANALTQGAGNVANLGMTLARTAIGGNGLGGFFGRSSGGGYSGYGT